MGSDTAAAAWMAELDEARSEAAEPDELDVVAGDPDEAEEPVAAADVPVEEPAADGPSDALIVEELRVDGTTQLALNMGGKQPTEAFLTVSVPKVRIASGRAFEKGDRLYIEIVAEVREVAQKDVIDKPSGLVVDCVQSHKAQAVDVVVSKA